MLYRMGMAAGSRRRVVSPPAAQNGALDGPGAYQNAWPFFQSSSASDFLDAIQEQRF
ncbi:UNVERIFIED_ORG: hypothetical protein BDU10_8626 [Burkholderia sp. CF145]